MYVGVDYYPEHWPEERWQIDAEMMQEAGINAVRLAEFAWIKMEPIEGVYDFSWLDKAIDILHNHGISVILGTPTGSMPAWVALKYPDTVATDRNGHKIPYGARKDNCPSSLSYRLLSQRITRAMAEHYRNNPAVIGWQTDNEFGEPNCYCDTCKAAWHDWLKERFGSIDKLNESWGTVFWSHSYRSFDEVPLPRRIPSNPSLELDYMRFYSDQVVSFQKEQIDILREVCPHQFITHNFMGFYDNLDYYKLANDLDFVSWDYYYNYGSTWDDRMASYRRGSASHDLMRSLKHKNFWIMETSAGPTGASIYDRNLRPKEMRRMNYQAVAHGADGLMWFRWRTSRYGQEQYWHGLLQHDGQPNRRYREAAQVAYEFQKLAPQIEGSQIKADVAIALSYQDRWAFRIQPNSNAFNYVDHMMRYYKALVKQGINIDFVNLDVDDISSYKLLIVPTAYIMTDQIADKLDDFARNGGTVVLTFRSGVKDVENVPYDMVLPGFLKDMAGIRIEEYEALNNRTAYRVVCGDKRYSCSVFADWIIPEKAMVLARYEETGIDEYAAATINHHGNGTVYYIGTCFDDEEFYDSLLVGILQNARIKSLIVPPKGVEICTRYKGETVYAFILNHNDHDVSMTVPYGVELVSGRQVGSSIDITAGDVAVLEIK